MLTIPLNNIFDNRQEVFQDPGPLIPFLILVTQRINGQILNHIILHLMWKFNLNLLLHHCIMVFQILTKKPEFPHQELHCFVEFLLLQLILTWPVVEIQLLVFDPFLRVNTYGREIPQTVIELDTFGVIPVFIMQVDHQHGQLSQPCISLVPINAILVQFLPYNYRVNSRRLLITMNVKNVVKDVNIVQSFYLFVEDFEVIVGLNVLLL